MIASFIAALRATGLDPTAEEVADVIWLALHANQAQMPPRGAAIVAETGPEPPRDLEAEAPPSILEQEQPPLKGKEEAAQVLSGSASTQEVSVDGRVYTWPSREASTTRGSGIPFRSPGARALPSALELSRALRPLMRRAASRTERVLDDEGTINRIAEEGIWLPVLRPAQTRWLEIALMIDDGPSMRIWKQPIKEFKRLLELLGAFRDVRAWRLDTDFSGGSPLLHAGDSEAVRSPTELIDPTGRRIIIVVTDCVSPAWDGEYLPQMLAEWGSHHPLAILQMLPQKLWAQTSLYAARSVRVRSSRPAQPNSELFKEEGRRSLGRSPSKSVPIPVFTLEPTPAAIWSRLVSGPGGIQAPAFILPSGMEHLPERLAVTDPEALTPANRLEMFRAKVSSTAFELARILAAAPLTLPVMRLIQRVMLPQSRQEHLAEVFLGGILQQLDGGDGKSDPDDIRYDFLPGVRDLLLNSVQVPDSVAVIKIVSKYLEKRLGQSLDFAAILANPSAVGGLAIDQGNQEFARIGTAVLKRLGGRYASVAERLEVSVENQAVVADASDDTVKTLPGEGEEDAALRDAKPPDNAVNTAVAEMIAEALWASSSTLNLSSMGLTEVPEAVFVLTELHELDLSNNQLKKLPNKIGRLSGLERLDLSHNLLIRLPTSLGALSRLEELHLTHNRLAAMTKRFASLSRLRHLCLNHNRLAKLPAWIDSLTGLEGLELSGNKLSSLPYSVGGLSKLKELRLDKNMLTDLPESLRHIPALERLYLHGNHSLGLPAEVLGEDPDGVYLGIGRPANPKHILDYYFRVRGNRRPLNEAKLILVGRGAVGKTSIVNRLIHDKFEDVRKTEGISITEWALTVGVKDDRVRLNVWDFGGQEIMHATHQFFLTERSIYLLVLSGREGVEDVDAEYWLRLIQSFGGDSPVIVVLNKIKEHPFDVNRNALLRKYPFIREFIKTDCTDGTGIHELRSVIERETDKLEHLRDAFPAAWFSIKDRLTTMRRDYISFDEFRRVCAELGEPDPEAQESLAFYLHNLGIALNYKDDTRLRDMHVLNPRWVTGGIYKILSSNRLERQKGEMDLNDLSSILDERQYPRAMHGFLLDLMKKFELCFNLEGKESVYLIPELLDKQEPVEAGEFDPEECLNFQYHYPVLPEGLLPRFIVRTHVLSERSPRWRTGVILEFERNRALVRGDVQDEKIFISISGPASSRRRLLGLIRSEFANIHRSIRKLNPREMVPLSDRPHVFVPYEELVVLEKQGVATFPKVIGGEVIELDVKALLNGVDLEDDHAERYQKSLLDNQGQKSEEQESAEKEDIAEGKDALELPHVLPPALDVYGLISISSQAVVERIENAFRAETEKIAGLLREGTRAVTIHGTRSGAMIAFTRTLAERLTPELPDAQFYFDMRHESEGDPLNGPSVAEQVVQAYRLKIPPDTQEADLHKLYLSTLEGRRVLIVAANVQFQKLSPLKPPLGNLLVVTSRWPDVLPGAYVVDLDSLVEEIELGVTDAKEDTTDQSNLKAKPVRDKVFISYSHKDEIWIDRLQIFLRPLMRRYELSVWDDTKIKAGTEWRAEIEKALASAKVAVLLVSPNFLASDFIANNELPLLLEAAEKGELKILWVAIGHSLYKETELVAYQAANDPSKPLSSLSRSEQEKALLSIYEQINDALNSGDRADNKDLSDLEYRASLDVVAIDIYKLLSDLIAQRKKQIGRTILWQFDRPNIQVYVRGNRDVLQELFSQVIDNARNALERVDSPRIVISTELKGDVISISIADNGPGINVDAEKMKLLFEGQVKLKDKGKRPWGLFIARSIAQYYGGEIFVASTGHSGTVITINLPVQLEQTSQSAILLVDDDLSFLDSLKIFLTHKGYKVFTAHDAAAARSVINDVPIDLVILDLRLSDDYDYNDQSGLNLAEEEAFRGIPIIVYTGYLASWTAVEALRSKTGASPLIVDIIEKGADTNRLLVTIERELKKRISISDPIQFYSCFISYSSRDEEFARRLYSRLRDEGIRVWYAPEDVRGGERLYEQIDRAIQIHDRVLLILSENSLRSEWVATEIRRTRKLEIKENRRKLFPIRVVDYESIRKWECIDIETGKDLATEIREYFIPDFSGWKDHDSFEASFSRLLRDIKSTEVPITKLPLEEQEAWLLQTLETNPQHPSARFELAKIHQRQGKLDEAEADLLKLLEIDASSLDVRTVLAKIYQRQNRLAEAEAVLLKSLEIDPQQLHPRTELAKIYQRQNRLSEAEAVLLKVLNIESGDLGARAELAKVYQRQGRLNEAEAMLLESLEIEANQLHSRMELSKIYQRQNKLIEAEAVLLEILELDVDNLQVRTELAKIYQRQGKLDEAIRRLEEEIIIAPEALQPRTELAKIYQRQLRFHEAEDVLLESLKIDPRHIQARTELAKIYYRQNKFADAETLLLTSLQIDQNQLSPRIELARIYKKQGRLNESEKVAEEVLAIDPLNDFAISELLAIWQRQGEKEKCAQRFLEFIVQPSYRFTRYSQASVFRFFRCCKAFNMKEYAAQVFERFQSELDDQNLKYYMSAFSNK